MRALALCVVVLAVATLAASVEPARACSCIPPDPWSFLKQADGAFVGRLVSRREADEGRAVLTFRVERAVKGRIGATIKVTTANNGAACGIETSVGQRIGLFLERAGDGWFGHLCWQVAPEDLLAAALLHAPNGKGPVALFVGGRFGPARTLALDAKGRTLAYGLGRGNAVDFSVCPSGRHVAELVAFETPDPPYESYSVAIRELPSLRLIRTQPLRLMYVGPVRCQNAIGEEIVIFSGSGPSLEQPARLVRLTRTNAKTIWRGRAWYAPFREHIAYVQDLGSTGTTIVAVDLRTSAAKKLGTVARGEINELSPNAAGTVLAGDSSREGLGDQRLLVIDLVRRPIELRSIPMQWDGGEVLWFRDDLFAYTRGREILVYSSALRLLARVSGWGAESAALVDSTAFGVRSKGRLVSAKLPAGPTRLVRRLPGAPYVIAAAAR